jgi:hypothetical protein
MSGAQGRSGDGLRASHADREQVIGTLKAAFVEGRLTGDELGERAGRAWASRTYAELAEITADIPAERTRARSPRAPWRATKIAWRAEYAVLLPGIISLLALKGPHTTAATVIIVPTVVYLVFWILGAALMIAARPAKRPAGQRPPQPGPGPAASGAPRCIAASPAQEAAPVITLGDEPADGDCLPVSPFVREAVTGTLKAALVQGRLTQDEHDARMAQASASRSAADLAALTADLPAGLTARPPAARDVWTGVGLIMAAISVLAPIVLLQPDNSLAFMAALAAAGTILLAPGITVGLLVDVLHQRRSGRRGWRSSPPDGR